MHICQFAFRQISFHHLDLIPVGNGDQSQVIILEIQLPCGRCVFHCCGKVCQNTGLHVDGLLCFFLCSHLFPGLDLCSQNRKLPFRIQPQTGLIFPLRIVLVKGGLQKLYHIFLAGKIYHIFIDLYHIRTVQSFLNVIRQNLRHAVHNIGGVVYFFPQNFPSLCFQVTLCKNQLRSLSRNPLSCLQGIFSRILRVCNSTDLYII